MNGVKKFILFGVLIALVFILATGVSAVTLSEWQLTTNGVANNVNPAVIAGNFVGGSGISTISFGSNGASASSWPISGQNTDDYFQASLTATGGNSITITQVNFGEGRSGAGIMDFAVQWSKNPAFTLPTTILAQNVPDDDLERDRTVSGLNILVNNGETIYFRWFGFNAEDAVGTWRINDGTLKIEGSVTGVPNADLTMAITRQLGENQSGELRLTNTGNVPLNLALSETTSVGVTLSQTTVNNLAAGASQNIEVTLPSNTNFGFGTNSVTIRATDTVNSISKSVSFSVSKGFCRAGQAGGNLKITDVDISNEGEGDDNEWQLLDEIEVQVDIDNDGSIDIEEVFVELGLFDSSGQNQVDELTFESADEEEFDYGDLDSGDDDTVTFNFKVPADFEDGNYKLAVKVYSDDLGESVECADHSSALTDGSGLFEAISVDRENDEGKFISFDNIIASPSEATCGDRVSLSMSVTNIGDEDQDQVRVNLENSELNIDQSFEIRNDLDQGDEETVTFDFAIPQDAEDKTYSFRLSADYDYSRGSYRQSSDEDTIFSLSVLGCGAAPGPGPTPGERIASISARLDSEATAGSQIVVKSTITNLKSERLSFVINAEDYDSWASLDSISPRVVELDAGESKDVTFTFDVNDDVEGEESFTIQVISGSLGSETREVVVDIEPADGAAKPGFNLGDNAYLWAIGIVNVILIILIIIIAVRISRK